ncbi:MAG: dTMP kinase [Gemmatimonas sp.]|jgi:dTMP kinase|uniref:dTMP kinase n=1 Tax=Gemmatimonas sp. UBA7669 TaxID=1946568 RepID=UPI0025C06538|nr:dTMP kinase [Gemmatimonas sp. UBA7669]MBA3919709.1 dTMP kinase [Gemmatimonas sp.]
MSPATGLFLVLEGGEGVGKTTQWQRLGDTLRAVGLDVVTVREPGGTPAGDHIRALLLDPASSLAHATEALLFAASRAQLLHDVVEPALARGAVVLVDRFLLSTYAYQGAGRGLPMESLRRVNALATGGRTPDLTLLLAMPLATAQARAAARGAMDRMEQETSAFHERVSAAFTEALLPAWQDAHPEVGPVVAVDADTSVDAVTVRCLAQLVQRWPERFRDAARAASVSLSGVAPLDTMAHPPAPVMP